jgi:hypothetical protein
MVLSEHPSELNNADDSLSEANDNPAEQQNFDEDRSSSKISASVEGDDKAEDLSPPP